ncbi:unnamed protein product [Sphenostylis stenocarpa]|uniref:Pentatricopeptide repeat-containing protein n=1 Tax=Sphenostylis stenocarpa TaxID=92480 RepID=A0AA86STF8_9FABA|nr:unnamed protein product [Sphenostylis stenocarpa]
MKLEMQATLNLTRTDMISRTLGRVVPLKFTLLRLLSPFSTIPNSDTAILARLKHKDWLTPKEATNLLTSLTHPSSTLSFFNLYTSRKDFDPTEPVCTTLVAKLAQAQHLNPLIILHHSLTLPRPQRRRLSDNFFFTLIKAYAHSFQRVDHALRTLHEMPCAPSTRTFNFVLNLLVNTRLYYAARDLFLQAPQLGVALDTCSLNILIKGLCAQGELNAAFELLEEFPKLGCEANAWTYATLMKGLCERGKMEEAFGLLGRMEGGGVDADVAVFNVLIGGLRKWGRVDDGWKVLEGMMGKGVCPNGGSYNEVLCGLLEGGRFEEAKEVVERMGVEGFAPSFEAYKGLVKGFCERGVVDEVEWVIRDMVRKGFVPKMGMWRKIVQCVVEREGSSGCVAVAIDGILEVGKLQPPHEAMLHVVVFKVGFDMNLIVGNGLIALYGKCGCLLEADVFLLKCEAGMLFHETRCLKPAVTDVSSENVWNVKGDVQEFGEEKFVLMECDDNCEGGLMNMLRGRSYVQGYNVVALFTEMLNIGQSPDSIFCVATISACSYSSLHNGGKFYFKQMTDHYTLAPRTRDNAVLKLDDKGANYSVLTRMPGHIATKMLEEGGTIPPPHDICHYNDSTNNCKEKIEMAAPEVTEVSPRDEPSSNSSFVVIYLCQNKAIPLPTKFHQMEQCVCRNKTIWWICKLLKCWVEAAALRASITGASIAGIDRSGAIDKNHRAGQAFVYIVAHCTMALLNMMTG